MKHKSTANLYCYAYGHNFFRVDDSPHLICKNCKQHFTYNTHGDIVPVAKTSEKVIKKHHFTYIRKTY